MSVIIRVTTLQCKCVIIKDSNDQAVEGQRLYCWFCVVGISGPRVTEC